MATALALQASPSTVRWVDCPHKLGSLPRMNHQPHEGKPPRLRAPLHVRFHDDE